MESNRNLVFISSLVLSLATILPHQIGGSHLVEQVCSHTHNKDKCVESFKSHPGSEGAHLEHLGEIAIEIAIHNATYTTLYIKHELGNQTLEPLVQQALSECYTQYENANEQLEASIAALTKNGRHEVRTWMSAAVGSVKICEDGLRDSGSQDSAMVVRNAGFRQLCNNAMVINNILTGKDQKWLTLFLNFVVFQN